MVTVMIVGLAMGSTVTIGRAVGAKELKRTSLTVGNTISLFMGVSVALTVLLLLLVRPIVAVMSTPQEAVAGGGASSVPADRFTSIDLYGAAARFWCDGDQLLQRGSL